VLGSASADWSIGEVVPCASFFGLGSAAICFVLSEWMDKRGPRVACLASGTLRPSPPSSSALRWSSSRPPACCSHLALVVVAPARCVRSRTHDARLRSPTHRLCDPARAAAVGVVGAGGMVAATEIHSLPLLYAAQTGRASAAAAPRVTRGVPVRRSPRRRLES
jgi:hypothetical protein